MERPNDYIALLAHELRNLLAPIRYALATLEKTELTAQQGYALGVMRRQSSHMSRLLEDLLDVARFTRGEFELRQEATDLTAVLRSAIEAARPFLEGKQHALAAIIPEGALSVWADPVRLVQVFSNLLINAAKYTDRGGRIELSVRSEADCVVVCVRDTGIGISREMMPNIFTLFAQDPAARSHSQGGLGIGLALVHAVVTLHEGSISAQSAGPGLGSEFIIRLPAGRTHSEPTTDGLESTTQPKRLRVLVVDDNKDVADTCSMLINMSGHQVETVYSGTHAKERAEAFRPHVVLTDIGLPDIDGHQFALWVRSTSWGAATVLVAITGWSDEEHAQSQRAGSTAAIFSHYLTKPIDPDTIEELLARVVI